MGSVYLNKIKLDPQGQYPMEEKQFQPDPYRSMSVKLPERPRFFSKRTALRTISGSVILMERAVKTMWKVFWLLTRIIFYPLLFIVHISTYFIYQAIGINGPSHTFFQPYIYFYSWLKKLGRE